MGIGTFVKKWKDFKKEKKKPQLEQLKRKAQNKKQKKILAQHRRHKIREYLLKAGLGMDLGTLAHRFFKLAVLINLLLSAYLIFHFSTSFGYTWEKVALIMGGVWLVVFFGILFAVWVLFYLFIDLRIYRRKVTIEDVLGDFLQLTAANIKAGMTVDRALWYAVRPRFGVLAKEIEDVAKETIGGEDLKAALQKFSAKYDSPLLQRSISLVIEGMDSGGEIGDLLDKIASNIEDQKLMVREMSANVTTYMIFIVVAAIIAAPVLFALSTTLIQVITDISGSFSSTNAGGSTGAISFSGAGITVADFQIFSMVSLSITAIFSALLLSMIKSGTARNGVKNIPLFIIVSLSLYSLAAWAMQGLFGIIF